MPEFRPQVVTQLPKPSIGPAIASGVAGLTHTLGNALDPLEAAKRKYQLSKLQMQSKILQDYKSGKIDKSKFYLDSEGMPHIMTPEQEQMFEIRAFNFSQAQKTAKYQEDGRKALAGEPSHTFRSHKLYGSVFDQLPNSAVNPPANDPGVLQAQEVLEEE